MDRETRVTEVKAVNRAKVTIGITESYAYRYSESDTPSIRENEREAFCWYIPTEKVPDAIRLLLELCDAK